METWGYSRLTKLYIRASAEELGLRFENPTYRLNEPLFPVLPRVKILYEDLDDLAESLRGCCEYQYSYTANSFHLNQADGFVFDVLDLTTPDSLNTFEYRLSVAVSSSNLWSVCGSEKIESVTVVMNVRMIIEISYYKL